MRRQSALAPVIEPMERSHAARRLILRVLEDVDQETDRARLAFGDQYGLTQPEWLAVLAEELGEAAKEVVVETVPPTLGLGGKFMPLRGELVQVAAVAVRWIAAIDARRIHEAHVQDEEATNAARS